MSNIKDFKRWFLEEYDSSAWQLGASRFIGIERELYGWSACGLMHLLNTALSFMDEGEEYLEVGTYGGRSLVAALKDNDNRAQVIDPFPGDDGEDMFQIWSRVVDEHKIRDRVTFHREFCEKFAGEMT